jgi:tRNA (guanosine-2'-O-)-methyltransferase
MKPEQKEQLIKQVDSKTTVETLGPYVTEARKSRIEAVLNGRLRDIQLAIEAPSDINNALAAVRSSEALGVSKVHIITPEGEALGARVITQGAIYWVEVIFYDSWGAFYDTVKSEGLQLAGGTVTASKPLSEVPVDKPLCIIVGNEQRGLSAKAVDVCDFEYKIPMYGMTESFNLSVSAAISLYDTTTRKRKLMGRDSDLSANELQDLTAQYYLKSISKDRARKKTPNEIKRSHIVRQLERL